MKYSYLILFTALWACAPFAQSSTISDSNPKTLQFSDIAYEQEIKTVLLHPSEGQGDNVLPAVTRLGQWNLILEFDDMRSQRDNYYLKILYCNHDWTKSDLLDLDYMTDYNEFTINNAQYSIDTQIPYVHYTFNLPALKLAGNYLVIVYRNGDQNDLVLSKRFMVYDPKISFIKDGNLLTSGKLASRNQQINFTLDYKNVTIPNPMENLWVVIRQNQRWDNTLTDLKPSFIHDIEQQLDYIFFDEKKMFSGGNEFRFFDLRSINYPGQNVGYVNKTVKPFEAYIQKDKSRADAAYTQNADLDGNFIISNLDYNDINFANYINVIFTLSTSPITGDVYVAGAYNYWNLNDVNKMKYDSVHGEYTSKVQVKQGLYNYQYVVKSPSLPSYYFEGTHFETQNSYEIFVYYKSFLPRADQLIGYLNLQENKR